MSGSIVCPGCGGPKTRRAVLCRACRGRANVVGARTWVETGLPAVPNVPRTKEQSKVYHGKLTSIATLEGRTLLEVKAWALERATAMFGRPFESSTELREIEMELLLESFDRRLEELGYTR